MSTQLQTKYNDLKKEQESLNNDKVRLSTNLERENQDREKLIAEILELSKTESLESAKAKKVQIDNKITELVAEAQAIIDGIEK